MISLTLRVQVDVIVLVFAIVVGGVVVALVVASHVCPWLVCLHVHVHVCYVCLLSLRVLCLLVSEDIVFRSGCLLASMTSTSQLLHNYFTVTSQLLHSYFMVKPMQVRQLYNKKE